MEYNIRKVDNGFVVKAEGRENDDYVEKELVFTNSEQVLQFLQENFNKKD